MKFANEFERFKFIREEMRMTQAEFSNFLELKENAVRFIEQGKQKISNEILEILFKKFNISPAWILFEVGSMKMTTQLDIELPSITKYLLLINYEPIIQILSSKTRDLIAKNLIDHQLQWVSEVNLLEKELDELEFKLDNLIGIPTEDTKGQIGTLKLIERGSPFKKELTIKKEEIEKKIQDIIVKNLKLDQLFTLFSPSTLL